MLPLSPRLFSLLPILLALQGCSLIFTGEAPPSSVLQDGGSQADAQTDAGTQCGNSKLERPEECDDGNELPGDGCDESCKVEAGWVCRSVGSACTAVRCGDGVRAGDESCDDGNSDTGDGCTPSCTLEPDCTSVTCQTVCGDGIVLMGEACDDHNLVSGDGCDSSCNVEPGFTCTDSPPTRVVVPMVVRDFIAIGTADNGGRPALGTLGTTLPFGHPDFEKYFGVRSTLRMVQSTLDSNGKPVRRRHNQTTSDTSFGTWYRSAPEYNLSIQSSIALDKQSGESYLFDAPFFFPATGKGFDTQPCADVQCEGLHQAGSPGNPLENFHFTTEAHFWFVAQGMEKLTFRGDDDVWVFINNQLAVDIGGIHGPTTKSWNITNRNLGILAGELYEVAIFQAERRTNGSQYTLTLSNWALPATSICSNSL